MNGRARSRPAAALLLIVMGFALAAPGSLSAGAVAAGGTPTSRSGKALRLLTDLVHGADQAVVATFNSQMKKALSAARLAGDWTLYQTVFGRYLGHGRPLTVLRGTLTVIRVPLHMARRPGEFRITFQANGLVAGLYLLRTGVPL